MMTDKEKTICLKETVAKLWEILPLQEKKELLYEFNKFDKGSKRLNNWLSSRDRVLGKGKQ